MESRLKQDSSWVGESSLARRDSAQSFVKARAAVGDSAFSKEGRTLTHLGDVKETFRADLEKFKKKVEGDEADAEEDAEESPGKKGLKGVGLAKKDRPHTHTHSFVRWHVRLGRAGAVLPIAVEASAGSL
jgi:hypothetical protein